MRATVRFVIEAWRVKPDEKGYEIASTVGHGTVKDGRFLVTHNHFDFPLPTFSPAGQASVYSRILIYDASGRLLYDGPMTEVSAVTSDAAMLILDFRSQEGEGFFEALGFASASFLDSTDIDLQPGMEVAQLDWDGSGSRIDWTIVEKVDAGGDAPHLQLQEPILAGASGGGVFWNGYHVANNWARLTYFDSNNRLIGEHSTAALNTFAVNDR